MHYFVFNSLLSFVVFSSHFSPRTVFFSVRNADPVLVFLPYWRFGSKLTWFSWAQTLPPHQPSDLHSTVIEAIWEGERGWWWGRGDVIIGSCICTVHINIYITTHHTLCTGLHCLVCCVSKHLSLNRNNIFQYLTISGGLETSVTLVTSSCTFFVCLQFFFVCLFFFFQQDRKSVV